MEAGALVARERLQRRGVRLEWFTVVWNVAEALVAIVAGLAAGAASAKKVAETMYSARRSAWLCSSALASAFACRKRQRSALAATTSMPLSTPKPISAMLRRRAWRRARTRR